MPIRTFEDFIKKVLEISFWATVFITVFGFFGYYMLERTLYPVLSPLLQLVYLGATNPFGLLASLSQETWFKIIVYPGFTFVSLYLPFIVLWERKLVAKIQLRVGPQYAGRYEGILQNFADMIKMIFKEVIVPAGADRLIFLAAPVIFTMITGSLLAVVPVSPTSFITDSPVHVLLVFGIISLSPIVVLLAAWSSNNKFSLVGGLRALHQLVAYEIPMVVSALGVVVLTGSMSFLQIVEAQSTIPFIVLQPLGAFVFFVTMMAELERHPPFDIPEADTEIVAGWLTEYSGLGFFLLFAAAPVIELYALAGVFTHLFLAGWIGPSFLPSDIWFFIKQFAVMTATFAFRAIYPRYRIDQLLRIGWSYFLGLAFVNLAIAALIVTLKPLGALGLA